MKISIVTPSYNQGQFIEKAIQSVLDQNYLNFEHIIIDNCSTDQTSEILEKYPHLKIICEADTGQSDALNKGFKIATGEIVGWLNSDDRYLQKCFDEVQKTFLAHHETDIVYGDYYWIEESGKIIQTRREIDFDLFILKYLHVLYIPTTTSFFRRKIFDENNFLDCNINYAMDYDFFLRLALQKYKIKHVKRFWAEFRWHQKSKSNQMVKNKYYMNISLSQDMNDILLRQDKSMQNVPKKIQGIVIFSLRVLARIKRYGIKFFSGFYLDQWRQDD